MYDIDYRECQTLHEEELDKDLVVSDMREKPSECQAGEEGVSDKGEEKRREFRISHVLGVGRCGGWGTNTFPAS